MPLQWSFGRLVWRLRRVPGEDVEELSCCTILLAVRGDLTQRGKRVLFLPRMSKAAIVSQWYECGFDLCDGALAKIGVVLDTTDQGAPAQF